MRTSFLYCPVAMLVGIASVTPGLAQQRMPQSTVPAQPTGGQPATGQPTRVPVAGQTLPGAGQPGANPNDALFRQQVSYSIGRGFGENLRSNEVDLDIQMLVAGITEGLQNAKSKWTDDELEAAMQRFSQIMQNKADARQQAAAAKNKQQEEQFLAENKKRDGVQVTPSGLQFKVVQQGNGPSPTAADMVRCNYRGQLLDGTEFDSSQRHGGPQEFPVGRVIPGWTEALQKMHVGDKWQLFVPARLAYNMDPPGPPIEPGSMLIFEIELLGIVTQPGR